MIISWLSTFNYGNIKKSRLIQSLREIQSIPILNRQSKSHSTEYTVNLILIIIHHYRKSTSSSLFSFSTIFCPKWCWWMPKPSFPQNLAVSPRRLFCQRHFSFPPGASTNHTCSRKSYHDRWCWRIRKTILEQISHSHIRLWILPIWNGQGWRFQRMAR